MADLELMADNLFEINEGWTSIQSHGGDVHGSVRMRPSAMGDFSTSWARNGEVFELSSMLTMSPALEKRVRMLMPGDYVDSLPDLLSSVRIPLGIEGVRWSLVTENERLGLDLVYDWFMDEELFDVTATDVLLTSLVQLVEGLEWFLERMISALYLLEAPGNPVADRDAHLASMLEKMAETIGLFLEQSGEA